MRVEIRVALHALSIPRLPQLATFLARNFPFACHIALMGLEMFGLVPQHLDELWIDPATTSANCSPQPGFSATPA